MTDPFEARPNSQAAPDEEAAASIAAPGPDSAAADPARYYAVDELARLPQAALEALVDDIPAERLRWYESVLSGQLEELYGHGEVDEAAALDVIRRLLDAYERDRRVPIQVVGKWVVVPESLRRHVEQGEERQAGLSEAAPARPPIALLVAALAVAVLLVVLTFSLIRRATGGPRVAEAELTATPGAAAAAAPEEAPPTATPLALEAADRVIERGEDLRRIYPVLLEVAPGAGEEGRVFVVQQKAVGTADWDWSREPDTASWVSGLVVRPVLGIPYTPDTAAFLAVLAPGDTFLLRMSTGALLAFEVEGVRRVGRQDTAIFRQVSPGIVVVMLAEPAADRLVLFGRYAPEQEVSRPDALQAAGVEVSAVVGDTITDEASGLRVTVTGAASSRGPAGAALPDDLAYFVVDARLEAGDAPLEVASLRLDLTDSLGNRHTPVAAAAPAAAYLPPGSQRLAPGQALEVSLTYLVPRSLPREVVWRVQARPGAPTLAFALAYEPPPARASGGLAVMLLGVEASGEDEEDGLIEVAVRVFNAHEVAVELGADDVFAVSSPVDPGSQFPAGPRLSPAGWQPLVVRPGEALDLALAFAWDGSPYLGLHVAGHEYLVTQAATR